MKNVFILFFLVCGMSIASANQYYVGLDFNEIKVNTGITNISSNLDEEDTVLKFTGGYKLNDKISLEAFYMDFGEASLSGVSGNQFSYGGSTYEFITTATIALSADTVGVGARYNIYKEGNSVYTQWQVFIVTMSHYLYVGTGSASVSESGSDPYYGIGYNC